MVPSLKRFGIGSLTPRPESQWIDYFEEQFENGNLIIWIPETNHSHEGEGILRMSDGAKIFGE